MTCWDAEQVVFREMRSARNLELSVLRVCQQAPNQRPKLLVRQRCKLQEAGVQPLELALREGVEIDATNAFLGTRPLQPTQKNLGGTRIGNSPLAQTTLDFCVGRRLTLSARCARDKCESMKYVCTLTGVPACLHRPSSACPRALAHRRLHDFPRSPKMQR